MAFVMKTTFCFIIIFGAIFSIVLDFFTDFSIVYQTNEQKRQIIGEQEDLGFVDAAMFLSQKGPR